MMRGQGDSCQQPCGSKGFSLPHVHFVSPRFTGLIHDEEEMSKLNRNQERFAQEIALNPKANVLECYVTAGYAEHEQNAYRLFNIPGVQARVKELQDQHIDRLSVTREQVVEGLAKIAFADISSILDCYGRLLPVIAWPEAARDAIASLEIDPGTGVVTGAKLSDRLAALKELAKILGMYQDGLAVANSAITVVISEKDALL